MTAGRSSGDDIIPIGDARLDNLPPARAFADYRIAVDKAGLPEGVEILELL